MKTARKRALVIALAATMDVTTASAVRLDPDGRGEVLIYPYFTVQSDSGGAFNTYLSLVNHTGDAKALRVRFRESRLGQEVASLNLYLSPNDMWTAALVPHAEGGASLVTSDVSCTDPILERLSDFPAQIPGEPRALTFSNRHYTADGAGAGLDRTREGYVEILEMATLTGSSLVAATHNSPGFPSNCSFLRGNTSPNVAPPSGGLSGTLTLIDVTRGMDFTLKAEALADLAQAPYFRLPSDPYPNLDVAEIAPVSVVSYGGSTWLSVWPAGSAAVDAALMRSSFDAEFVLDTGTRSRSDLVLSFPTRHLGLEVPIARPPFSGPPAWSGSCAGISPEYVTVTAYTRGGLETVANGRGGFVPIAPLAVCASSNSIPVGADSRTTTPSLLRSGTAGLSEREVRLPTTFTSGWVRITPVVFGNREGIRSLPSSIRILDATGEARTGPHNYRGLPMIGFTVRSFENGTLSCGSGLCQGNYGGAFTATYRREITAP